MNRGWRIYHQDAKSTKKHEDEWVYLGVPVVLGGEFLQHSTASLNRPDDFHLSITDTDHFVEQVVGNTTVIRKNSDDFSNLRLGITAREFDVPMLLGEPVNLGLRVFENEAMPFKT